MEKSNLNSMEQDLASPLITPGALTLMGFSEKICKRGNGNGVWHKDKDEFNHMTYNTRNNRFCLYCTDKVRRIVISGRIDTVEELTVVLEHAVDLLFLFDKKSL